MAATMVGGTAAMSGFEAVVETAEMTAAKSVDVTVGMRVGGLAAATATVRAVSTVPSGVGGMVAMSGFEAVAETAEMMAV
jgi:hypothetical protein